MSAVENSAITHGAAPAQPPSESIWSLRWKRFRAHRAGLISIAVLLLLVVFCLMAAPLEAWRGLDANQTDLFRRYEPPSAQHWLGADEAGRDELLRLMYGGQTSLLVGLLATVIGGLFGVTLGVVAGFHGGRLDSFLMRFTDGMIALPLLPLLIVLGAVDLTKLGFSSEVAHSPAMGFWRIIVIIALVDWTPIARLVRASTLSIKEREFMMAARGSGAGSLYLMVVHVLPNVATPIIVAFTLTVGRVILFESVLSFLGFGVVPPTPSWGNMLNNAQELVTTAPALAIYPGLLIFITVIAVNFLGDALQHAFDPRSEK
ncbi:ABC transporter permease [Terrarubrum flagellatum]|uniref:ABC transporter permease n=1 Tax=Terrirubrum flagellatum TaxID=2895980 RepID=UPI0031456FDD